MVLSSLKTIKERDTVLTTMMDTYATTLQEQLKLFLKKILNTHYHYYSTRTGF